MSASVGASNTAAKIRWGNEVFEQMVVDENDLAPLMSPVTGSGIIVMDRPSVGDGLVYRVPFVEEIPNSAWTTGDARLSGAGYRPNVVTDSVTLQRERVAVQLENQTEADFRTAFDLPEAFKRKLARTGAKRIMNNILTAIAQPSTTTIQGRTQNRYLYGNSEANWNATHTTALASVNNTAGKLTLAGIDQAIYKARNQGLNRGFINPAEVTFKSGAKDKSYIMLIHPLCARDLMQDANFKNMVVYRSTDAAQFDLISGSTYLGKYNGVLLYMYQPLEPGLDPLLETGVGASGINVGHNLLLGQKAGIVSFGQVSLAAGADIIGRQSEGRLVITREVQDHGGNVEFGMTMVMGQKKLVDSSVSAEDFGVVHVFNAAVA